MADSFIHKSDHHHSEHDQQGTTHLDIKVEEMNPFVCDSKWIHVDDGGRLQALPLPDREVAGPPDDLAGAALRKDRPVVLQPLEVPGSPVEWIICTRYTDILQPT